MPDALTLTAGAVLDGRFELQSTLGRGGMATVYRAWDRLAQRPCAIKVLGEHLAGDEQSRRRFRQEAVAARRLVHPNIVRVDGLGEAGSHPYIVMEYVGGGTLRDLMRRGPLPQALALDLAIEVADALAHAHARGIVHRDIKPENLLLAEDRRIKVADFGIARAGDAATHTRTGIVMGSARYLSPEQARGRAAGPRSDLYALGVVLFEMLAGRLPFDGDSAVAVAVQHVQDRPPRLEQFRPDVSEPVAALVTRLLAKQEDDRYQTAGALAGDLRRLRARLPDRVEDDLPTAPLALGSVAGATAALSPADAATVPPTDGVPATGRPRSVRLAAVAAVLVALAVVVAARGHRAGPPPLIVPSLLGESEPVASATARAAGLRLVVAAGRQDTRLPPGLIVTQDPPPGASAGKESVVRVVVSQGSGIVPELRGLSLDAASRLVQVAGLRLRRIAAIGGRGSETIVFQLEAPGTHLPPNAMVNVVLGARLEKTRDHVPQSAPKRDTDTGRERN